MINFDISDKYPAVLSFMQTKFKVSENVFCSSKDVKAIVVKEIPLASNLDISKAVKEMGGTTKVVKIGKKAVRGWQIMYI